MATEKFRPPSFEDLNKQLERIDRDTTRTLNRQISGEAQQLQKQLDANQEKRISANFDEAARTGNSFSIESFRQEINRSGILPAHSFLLYINPKGVPYTTVDPRALVLRMESAQIPGVSLMLQDVFRYGYGPNLRMPHAAQYNVMSASFIVDGSAENYKFFYDWINLVVNHESQGGDMMAQNEKTKMYPYQVNYKKSAPGEAGGYALGQMNLGVYDRSNNKAMNVKFYDVYPFTISDLDLRWSEADTPIRATVQFVFTDLDISFDKIEDMAAIEAAVNPSNEFAEIKQKKGGILASLGRQIQQAGKTAVDSVIEDGVRTVQRNTRKIVKSIF